MADAKTVAEVIASQKNFKNFQSCRVWTQKHLNILAETGRLMRGDGFYALKDYRGQFKDHDRLLTKALAEILKLGYKTVIHREAVFEPALRSDAAILLKRGDAGLCLILEVENTPQQNNPNYLAMKINQWKRWPGANEALSKLFGYRISHFSIIVSRDQPGDQFTQFIGGLK